MPVFTITQTQDVNDNDFLSYSRFAKFPSGTLNFECNSLDDLCNKQSFEFVESNDLIYLNLAFPDNLNTDPNDVQYGWREGTPDWLLQVDIVYTDGSVDTFPDINTISSAFQAGFYEGKPFQRVALDMEKIKPLLNDNCFALRVTCQRVESDPSPLVCYYGVYKLLGNDVNGNGADCDETVLIQGVYYGYDCDGKFYGAFGDSNDYESPKSIRLRGNIETIEYPKEIVETDSGQLISSITNEKAIIRLYPFSLTQARELVKILSADIVLINGEEWQSKNGLVKDNDTSSKWHSTITIERLYCERNSLGCN